MTFDQKVPKLNSKLVYCSPLFGMLKKILISQFTTTFILMAKSWLFLSELKLEANIVGMMINTKYVVMISSIVLLNPP